MSWTEVAFAAVVSARALRKWVGFIVVDWLMGWAGLETVEMDGLEW